MGGFSAQELKRQFPHLVEVENVEINGHVYKDFHRVRSEELLKLLMSTVQAMASKVSEIDQQEKMRQEDMQRFMESLKQDRRKRRRWMKEQEEKDGEGEDAVLSTSSENELAALVQGEPYSCFIVTC